MSWRTEPLASAVAARVFPEHFPRVVSNGKQYLLAATPYGRVELLEVEEGFLVAAERPAAGARLTSADLPPEIRSHLQKVNLRPWKILHTRDVHEAIESLGGAPDPAGWHPWVAPLQPPPRLIGEARGRFCRQLSALLQARGSDAPLLEVAGPPGVGKRSLVAAAASRLNLTLAGQLPLGRVFCSRVLATPAETLLETSLQMAAALRQRHLLVATEGELLQRFGSRLRAQMIGELQRAGNVLLLATAPARDSGLITLTCPGLEKDEAHQLIGEQMPEASFAGTAFDLACRAATVEEYGVLPGRILYLVRLATALLNDRPGNASEKRVLSPDEMMHAIQLTSLAWNQADNGF